MSGSLRTGSRPERSAPPRTRRVPARRTPRRALVDPWWYRVPLAGVAMEVKACSEYLPRASCRGSSPSLGSGPLRAGRVLSCGRSTSVVTYGRVAPSPWGNSTIRQRGQRQAGNRGRFVKTPAVAEPSSTSGPTRASRPVPVPRVGRSREAIRRSRPTRRYASSRGRDPPTRASRTSCRLRDRSTGQGAGDLGPTDGRPRHTFGVRLPRYRTKWGMLPAGFEPALEGFLNVLDGRFEGPLCLTGLDYGSSQSP